MAVDQDLAQYAHAIDGELKLLRDRLTEVFYSNMDKYGIVATGRLKEATKITQNIVADDMIGGLEILTLKYGIVLQAKRRFVVKAPIEEIVAWIKAIGLTRFKNQPNKAPTEDMAIRRLAWGIKQHGRAKRIGADAIIASKSSTRRSDPWLYRDFFNEVKAFQETLAAKTNPELAQGVANAIKRQLIRR